MKSTVYICNVYMGSGRAIYSYIAPRPRIWFVLGLFGGGAFWSIVDIYIYIYIYVMYIWGLGGLYTAI